MTAAHCEVKLHGFRRTQDGVVVSFVVHPSEVPQCLALDPLGTRYVLAVAQIGDDEQPLQSAPSLGAGQEQRPIRGATAVVPERAENRDTPLEGELYKAPTGFTPWDDTFDNMPLANPAAENRDAAIVKRAGILSNDPRFWEWSGTFNADEAADFIRRACGIPSRRDLATNTGAAIRFQGLLDEFDAATGRRAEMRG